MRGSGHEWKGAAAGQRWTCEKVAELGRVCHGLMGRGNRLRNGHDNGGPPAFRAHRAIGPRRQCRRSRQGLLGLGGEAATDNEASRVAVAVDVGRGDNRRSVTLSCLGGCETRPG